MGKNLSNIFIIQPDKNISAKIESLLINSGYKICGTNRRGRTSFNKIKKSAPQLVIIENNLINDENGIDIAFDIKRKFGIPVILLIESLDKDVLKRIKAATIFGYILKPVNENNLIAAIEIVYNKFIYDKKIKESEQRYQGIVENLPLMLCRFLPVSGEITYINSNFCRYLKKSCEELIGKNFFEFIPHSDIKDLKKRFDSLNIDNPLLSFEHYEKRGNREIWQRRIDQAIFNDHGEVVEYQLITEDITERKLNQIEIEKKSAELKERVKELNCLYNISAIAEESENSLDDILSKIVSIIPDSMQYPEITCAKIEYNGRVYKTDNFKKSKSHLKKEIKINNGKAGCFIVCYCGTTKNKPPRFLKEEEMLVSEIAELIEKIIERHNTRNELKKLEKEIIFISEKERQRIGNELHDGLGQLLTGISFLFRTVKKNVNKNTSEQIKEIDELSKLIKEASVLCRQLSKGLPVINIDQNGLLVAIDQLANDLSRLYNINCNLNIKGDIHIKDNFTASQIYRIVQESVNNSIKHGEADSIEIILKSNKDAFYLYVKDNGKGMDANKKSSGMGINIMRYRADLIGGEFRAGNSRRGGFEVSVKIMNER